MEKKKFMVYFQQVNRTNCQILAKDENEAIEKAHRWYKRNFEMPLVEVEEGWCFSEDGEDK